MAIFLKGNKRLLYVTLGLGYGDLVIEGFMPILVTTRDYGRKVLEECIAKQIITADEAAMIEGHMEEAGVANDMSAIMDVVKTYVMPAGFAPSARFEACSKCADDQLPPHGHVMGRDEGGEYDMSKMLRTFEDAVGLVDNVVTSGVAHVLDGITMLKEMVEADVPVDMTETRRRYDALPDEVRADIMKKYYARSSTINIPGFGPAMVIEISLDSLFGDFPGRDN